MTYYALVNNPESFTNFKGWVKDIQISNAFKLKDAFTDIGKLTGEIYLVKILAQSKDVCIGKNGYTTSRFRILSICSVNESLIENYLILGVIPNTELITYCINNQYVDVLLHIAKEFQELLYDFVNNLISVPLYSDVIKAIVISGYDIHKDNDTMFLFAAASKNYSLCEFLLERGANIPKQVVIMYSSVDTGSLEGIKQLLEKYKDKVLD